MTVAELKAQIANLPDDMLVLIFDADASTWQAVDQPLGVRGVRLLEPFMNTAEYEIDDAAPLRAFCV